MISNEPSRKIPLMLFASFLKLPTLLVHLYFRFFSLCFLEICAGRQTDFRRNVKNPKNAKAGCDQTSVPFMSRKTPPIGGISELFVIQSVSRIDCVILAEPDEKHRPVSHVQFGSAPPMWRFLPGGFRGCKGPKGSDGPNG
jgi:hypothetical protein